MYKEYNIYLKINSFQSLGGSDGPGIRAVVFMQGCPLRCICCHNPDTWQFSCGVAITADELYDKLNRCRPYFGTDGGVTFSGGEPLMQAENLLQLFERLHSSGINIALDTSGCLLNDKVKALLGLCDLVILDYKYTDTDDYFKYTGCEKSKVDDFLLYLDKNGIKTWIRQVIIPGYNDSKQSVKKLSLLKATFTCIEKIELLPFRKLCIEKYRELGLHFSLENVAEADEKAVEQLSGLL